jgi:hypothetical protein
VVNRLYFGDNLKWLSDRKEFPDASVDLVYLDPPFNSNADYNEDSNLPLFVGQQMDVFIDAANQP